MRLNVDNPEFLENQIRSIDETNNYGILHRAFWSLSNQTLLKLLDELDSWEGFLGEGSIQKLILMKDEDNKIFLFYYALNENFHTDFVIEILEKIKLHFGMDVESFLSNIIFHVNTRNYTFLNCYSVLSRNFNFLTFFKWFQDAFGPTNFEKLLLLRNNEQESIIFNVFSKEQNSTSSDFDILNFLKFESKLSENFLNTEIVLQMNKFNENVVQQLFLRSDDLTTFNDFFENKLKISDPELKSSFVGSETFLFYFAQKTEENQEKYKSFLVSKFGDNILNEFFSNRSLYDIGWKSNRFDDFAANMMKFFDFVERNFGMDFLKQLIGFQASDNRTFLFPLFHVVEKCLMKILNDLFEKLADQKEFLEEFLLSVDEDGNTFLTYYFSQGFVLRMIAIFKDFLKSIKSNFSLEFLMKFLRVKNNKNLNFHQVLLENKFGGVERNLEILEILLEVIGDRDFFFDLIEQEKIPEQIKEFLEQKVEN
jgi:hypothetical protein